MVDVLDGGVEVVDDFQVQDEVIVFGEVILVFCGTDLEAGSGEFGHRIFEDCHGAGIDAEFELMFGEACGEVWEDGMGNRLGHEQSLHGIAYCRTLYFCIERNALGHDGVGIIVEVNVANAFVMFDDGDFGTFGDGADELLAAAGHAEVNVLGEGKEGGDGLAIGGWHYLNGVFGKLREGGFCGCDHDVGDGLV